MSYDGWQLRLTPEKSSVSACLEWISWDVDWYWRTGPQSTPGRWHSWERLGLTLVFVFTYISQIHSPRCLFWPLQYAYEGGKPNCCMFPLLYLSLDLYSYMFIIPYFVIWWYIYMYVYMCVSVCLNAQVWGWYTWISTWFCLLVVTISSRLYFYLFKS